MPVVLDQFIAWLNLCTARIVVLDRWLAFPVLRDIIIIYCITESGIVANVWYKRFPVSDHVATNKNQSITKSTVH